jgi:hypothetical protein
MIIFLQQTTASHSKLQALLQTLIYLTKEFLYTGLTNMVMSSPAVNEIFWLTSNF